jgi:hypothetical protein
VVVVVVIVIVVRRCDKCHSGNGLVVMIDVLIKQVSMVEKHKELIE